MYDTRWHARAFTHAEPSSAGPQQILKPLYRGLGASLEVVLVVHKVEPKPRGVSSDPLPVVQKRPHEVATDITPILPATAPRQ
jgi:hypothetical protein